MVMKKTCSNCGQTKEYFEFNKNSSSSDGFYSQCKECSRRHSLNYYHTIAKFREKTPEQKAAKYENNKKQRALDPYKRVAENHRAFARNIGMDYEELERWYTKQFLKQQAHCAICGGITEELCIDHNHETNELRGLLCRDCNYGIGCFKDNPQSLYRAGDYLVANLLVLER